MTTSNTHLSDEKIISRSDFRLLTGMSRTSEWRALRKGMLPKVIKLEGRILGYLSSSYQAWIFEHSFSK